MFAYTQLIPQQGRVFVVPISTNKAAMITSPQASQYRLLQVGEWQQLMDFAILHNYEWLDGSDERYATLWLFVEQQFPKVKRTVWERTGIRPLTAQEVKFSRDDELGYHASYGGFHTVRNYAPSQIDQQQIESWLVESLNRYIANALTQLLDRPEVQRGNGE